MLTIRTFDYKTIPQLTIVLDALLTVFKVQKKADDAWKDLPWKKFRRHVFRLQKAIFKAQKNGNRHCIASSYFFMFLLCNAIKLRSNAML